MKSKIVLGVIERIFDAGGIDDLVGGPAPEAGALYALLLECARGESGRCFDALSRVAARRRVTADYLIDRANVLVASAESRLAGDLYRILGVPPLATEEEIRTRWREVVKECHPDRMGSGAIERFRELRGAYEVLADPRRRADYERVWGATLEHIERARVMAENVELDDPEEFGQRATRTIRDLAARVGGLFRGVESEVRFGEEESAGEASVREERRAAEHDLDSQVSRAAAGHWSALGGGNREDGGDTDRADGPATAADKDSAGVPGPEGLTGATRDDSHGRRPHVMEPSVSDPRARGSDRAPQGATRATRFAAEAVNGSWRQAAVAGGGRGVGHTYVSPSQSGHDPSRLKEDKMHDVLRRTDAMLDTVRGIDKRLSGAGFDGVSAVARLFEQINAAVAAISLDDIDSTLADIDRAKQTLDAIGRDLGRLRRLKLVIDHTGPGC